ncbi:MAG TPA: hypothetical protein VF538_00195 [Pyrinomonadaceae bacterium]|jgi:uncharacterized protein Yka (UPF0111/DUF47 family)
MSNEATFGMLTAKEQSEYMDLVYRFIAIVERTDDSTKKASSIMELIKSGGTQKISQAIREKKLRSKLDKLEEEIDAFFDRIDKKYDTRTPHPRSNFPLYDDMYMRLLKAAAEKPFHL